MVTKMKSLIYEAVNTNIAMHTVYKINNAFAIIFTKSYFN